MRCVYPFKHAAIRIAMASCMLSNTSPVVIAGLYGPACPFVKRFEGTDYMFVWNPPLDDPEVEYDCEPLSMDLASGLYRTTDPPQLVWLDRWECNSSPEYLSADGTTLSFPGEFDGYQDAGYFDDVIMFVRNGSPAQRYYHHELSSFFWLKMLIADGEIEPVDEAFIDHYYQVTTNVGERFVFDCETGELVDHDDPVAFVVRLVISVATLLAVAAIVWWCKRRVRRLAHDIDPRLGEPSA